MINWSTKSLYQFGRRQALFTLTPTLSLKGEGVIQRSSFTTHYSSGGCIIGLRPPRRVR